MTAISIIGWALVHFLWQGTLVAAGLALALGAAGRRSSDLRHALSIVALMVMAALPIGTGVKLWGRAAQPPALSEGLLPAGDQAAVAVLAGAAAGAGAVDRPVPPAPGVSSEQPGAPSTVSRMNDAGVTVQRWLHGALPWLVSVWLAGVVLLSLRLLGGWAWARRLTRVGMRAPSQALQATLERLRAAMRVSREVRLLESVLIQVPAVVGWLRPVLLVPVSAATGLTPQQLEVLLAHELAHIRRHDYAVNLLQCVVETLLFYHPAVWWVSRQVREEREDCCDDAAVAVGANARVYATALLELETLRVGDLGLAAAASGGSLLRRVKRLLDPGPHHPDGGRHWMAGAIVVAVLVVLAGGARFSPAVAMAERSAEPAPDKSQAQWSVPAAEPDTVIIESSEGPLAERWTRASALARRQQFAQFWIGYAVSGDAERHGWLYFDRHSPIATSDGSIMSGHMRFKGEPGNLAFGGVRLDTLVGNRPPDDIVILYGFVVRNGRATLDRVHMGNVIFPVRFARRAVIWLGDADDAASLALTRDLYGQAPSMELRQDVVAIAGAHEQSSAVVPVLRRWLEGSEPEDVRAEAAEWLGEHPEPEALAALARAARADKASRVRAEAAEAVGDIDLPAAADTLVVLARTLPDRTARAEAVEALGARTEATALQTLIRIARDDPSGDIQREAVETLGDFEDKRGVPALVDLARTHPGGDVRGEALETLAEAAPLEQARGVLSDVAQGDPDVDVQRAAVEALGQLDDPAARRILLEIAERHPRVDVRVEAVETLGEAVEPDEAHHALQRIARGDRSPDVQREAVETLGEVQHRAVKLGLTGTADAVLETLRDIALTSPSADAAIEAAETIGELEDQRGVDILIELAERHPRTEVRIEAVEALGQVQETGRAIEVLDRLISGAGRAEVQIEAVETLGELHDHDPAVLARLARIARSHPVTEVQVEAVETYGEHAAPDSAAVFLADLVRTAATQDVRLEALETLADLEDGAGIPAIIEIARSHPDREVRIEAIERLGDSDDPRATRALEGLIRRP